MAFELKPMALTMRHLKEAKVAIDRFNPGSHELLVCKREIENKNAGRALAHLHAFKPQPHGDLQRCKEALERAKTPTKAMAKLEGKDKSWGATLTIENGVVTDSTPGTRSLIGTSVEDLKNKVKRNRWHLTELHA